MDSKNSIFNYIFSNPYLSKLYTDSKFTLTILKVMDENTKKLVFSLLVSSIHINNLKTIKNIKDCINTLLKVKLISKKDNIVYLDSIFRISLLNSFCLNLFDHRFIPSSTSFDNSIDESNNKFQQILESIIDKSIHKSHIISEMLLYSKIVDKSNDITNLGFEFLLKNKKDQLWFLILNSIKCYSLNLEEEEEILKDLSEICLKKKKCCYLTQKWCKWYSFLNEIGIFNLEFNHELKIKKIKSEENYPKAVFINNIELFGEGIKSSGPNPLILETNFKIYAYTNRKYEKNILNLFSKPVYNLPNLIKAQFDEEIIVKALEKGITANQIIKYLNEASDSVPLCVENQIKIWEAKQNRIKQTNGVLFNDFLHLSDYLKVLKFVEDRNALLFKDENKRIIVAEEEIYDGLKEFLKKIMN